MIRRTLDGLILGAIIGTATSAIYITLWYLMDRTLERLTPIELIGWAGIIAAITCGLLAALNTEEEQ